MNLQLPTTPDNTTSPTLHARPYKAWVLMSAGVVALMVVALMVVAVLQASAYQRKLGAWQAKTTLLAHEVAGNSFTGNMNGTAAQRDAKLVLLQQACTQDATNLSDIKQLGVPKPGFNPLGRVVPSYRHATADAQSMSRQIKPVISSLSQQLEMYKTFCQYYDGQIKLQDTFDSLSAKLPTGSITCASGAGCLPSDKSTWPAMAGVSQQLLDGYYRAQVTYLTSHACFFPDFGSICDVNKRYYSAYADAYATYIVALRQQSDTAATANQALVNINSDYYSQYTAIYKQTDPQIDPSNDDYIMATYVWRQQQVEQTIATQAATLAQLVKS